MYYSSYNINSLISKDNFPAEIKAVTLSPRDEPFHVASLCVFSIYGRRGSVHQFPTKCLALVLDRK